MSVNYGTPTKLDQYFQKHGYPSRNDSDEDRLRIMRGSLKAKKPKAKKKKEVNPVNMT